ncbi:MAG: hypothetical protein VZR53_14795 [Prevotella sp.]|nr:hypothetical protein [Prevotella sp.]
MMNFNRVKMMIITSILTGSLLLQGCTGSNSNPTDQINTTIDNGKINIEIDQTNHVFVITSDELGKGFRHEGRILTYSYPETANVYKVYPWDESQSSFSNPIKDWEVALFQVSTLMDGQKVYNNNMEGNDNLSRVERIGLINTLTRIDSVDFKQMNTIQSGYSDAVFGDYVLKYTFPATKKDLYEIRHFDLKLNYDIVLDDVKDRPIDYYVIRRSIDGIMVGLPDSVDLWYEKYDEKTKSLRFISGEEGKTFYDGKSIYEVHNNANATLNNIELYQKDQPVLSLEKAINKVSLTIYQSLSGGGDTYFYAAELVYLTVGITDCSDIDYYNANAFVKDADNAYIYPFWVIYVLDNLVIGSEDVAQRKPILVNAVTGEVIVCD